MRCEYKRSRCKSSVSLCVYNFCILRFQIVDGFVVKSAQTYKVYAKSFIPTDLVVFLRHYFQTDQSFKKLTSPKVRLQGFWLPSRYACMQVYLDIFACRYKLVHCLRFQRIKSSIHISDPIIIMERFQI